MHSPSSHCDALVVRVCVLLVFVCVVCVCVHTQMKLTPLSELECKVPKVAVDHFYNNLEFTPREKWVFPEVILRHMQIAHDFVHSYCNCCLSPSLTFSSRDTVCGSLCVLLAAYD